MPYRLSYPLAHGPQGYAIHKASEPTIPNDPAAPDTNNPMTASAASPHRERDKAEGRADKGRAIKRRVSAKRRADIDKMEGEIGGVGGLTIKQRAFCQGYLSHNGNATQAAISAGYSMHTATEMAAENLTKPHIRLEIARLKAENAREVDISPARVLRRLDAISQAAEADGQYSAARGCEELIGKHIGMFIERSLNVSVSASSAHLDALLEVARRRSGTKEEPTLIEG